MKKLLVLGTGLVMIFAFTSCKSSESAYKKAYEQAKQQEQVQVAEPVDVTPVVTPPPAPIEVRTENVAAGVREEKVTVVSGSDTLKDYNVVCGSFGLKANAEGLKETLERDGYTPTIAFNAEAAMYRVIVSTYTDYNEAARARDAFKARYPGRADFQGAWLLYRVF